jgi:hypothetical protein
VVGSGRLRAAFVAAAAVVGLAIGAYAALGAGSAAGTIRACANTKTGALRLLRTGQSCRLTESAVSWAQRGPMGFPGAAGPPGAQGPPGPAGQQGGQGPSGSNGSGGALAGVRVDSDGTILSWFNNVGGKPTITHTAPSRTYFISFPGLTFDVTTIVVATPEPHTTFPGFGSEEIVVSPVTSGGQAGQEQVTAFDQETSGATAGEPFNLIVFAGTAGP